MKIITYIAAFFVAKWRQIKRIPGLLKGSYRIIRKAPKHVQIVLLLFVIYLVSPLDVIPNFIPVIGVLDDILVLALMGRYVYRHVPELAEYWGMPAPKPTRKQRIAELELTLQVLGEQLAEQDMIIAMLRFENEAVTEGFDDLFNRVDAAALEDQNDF